VTPAWVKATNWRLLTTFDPYNHRFLKYEGPEDDERNAKLEYANDGQGDGVDWVVDY